MESILCHYCNALSTSIYFNMYRVLKQNACKGSFRKICTDDAIYIDLKNKEHKPTHCFMDTSSGVWV